MNPELNMNSEKGDYVTVMIVHGSVINRVRSRVLSVPVRRIRPGIQVVQRGAAYSITALRADITRSGGKKSSLRIKTLRINRKHRRCRTCQKRCGLDCCSIGGRIHIAESHGERCCGHSRSIRKGSKPLQLLTAS